MEAPQKTGQLRTQRATDGVPCRAAGGEGPGTGSPEEAPAELSTDSAVLEEIAGGTSQADRWEGPLPRVPHGTGEQQGGWKSSQGTS